MSKLGNEVPTLRILGTRGIPAAHGGFETFAEHLALFLVQRGWRVVVYCQVDGRGPIYQDEWAGVERVHIPVTGSTPGSTVLFDWKTILHASSHRDLCLTLGYNTAMFAGLLRLKGIPNIINMDGIEWARAKWGLVAKTWFWLNDWMGCWLGNHLVADHPGIAQHLQTRVGANKITMIPYGADSVGDTSNQRVLDLGLVPNGFLTLIARAEPENSILEVVTGFSMKPRGVKLVVLGKYEDGNAYHRSIKSAASDEVVFLGAIYDKAVVQSLRYHSCAYVHGHQVGGTNPSLVEALGAGNAVIAHDNKFNRWVAADSAVYFDGVEQFAQALERVLSEPARLQRMRESSRGRFDSCFTWPMILGQYEKLLGEWLPGNRRQDMLR